MQASTAEPPIALVTRFRGQGHVLTFAGRIAVRADGTRLGSLGDRESDATAKAEAMAQLPHGTPRTIKLEAGDLLIEAIATRPRIVIAGGGHVALAIARQAAMLDFDVTVEDRPEFATGERFPGATILQGDVPATLGRINYGWNSSRCGAASPLLAGVQPDLKVRPPFSGPAGRPGLDTNSGQSYNLTHEANCSGEVQGAVPGPAG